MPELNWVGKNKVVNHHLDVPYRVLERRYSFDADGQREADNGSKNMIIHGDNLEALKALLPRYEGQVDVIYIDPPYNTGNEGWVYNDAVNDPQIKKWLGEVVGKEGEDLSRHDKWLCMMYPRLRLLQRLLSPSGCLAISLSYHELPNLLLVLNEIFGSRQIVTTVVQTSGGKPSGGFNFVQEFLVFVTPREFLPNTSNYLGGKTRTPFEGLTLSTFDKTQRPNQVYPIFVDKQTLVFRGTGPSLQELISTGLFQGDKSEFVYHTDDIPEGCIAVWPITNKGKDCVWRQIPERIAKDWEKGYIKIGKAGGRISIQYLPKGVIKKIDAGELQVIGTEEGVPTLRFGENRTAGTQIPTMISNKEFYTVNGTAEIEALFPDVPKAFNYPKPTALVSFVVESLGKRDALVLDSFAGSGTTGQAVLNLNKQDGGSRSFILVELGDYADKITAERVKRVIRGYAVSESEDSGGDFSYFELGPELITDGNLNPDVPVAQVRDYIWFTETRRAIPDGSSSNPYYLGSANGAVYYFIYEPDAVTVLDHAFLATMDPNHLGESYIVYADLCQLSAEELTRLSIVFKKIPRDITRL